MTQAAKNSCANVEQCVTEHPQMSMLVSLGVGLGVGVLAGMMLGRNGRTSPSTSLDFSSVERLSKQWLDSIKHALPDSVRERVLG